jgi:hypothetical protein
VEVVVTTAQHGRDNVFILSITDYYTGNIRYFVCRIEVSLNGVFIFVLQYSLGDEIKKNIFDVHVSVHH